LQLFLKKKSLNKNMCMSFAYVLSCVLLNIFQLSNYSLHSIRFNDVFQYKSYCSTVHFCRITSIYLPTNAHIISHKTILKHFKTFRHVSILSGHHQEALFLAKVILQYSQFNSYLQTRCCGSISCCVLWSSG